MCTRFAWQTTIKQFCLLSFCPVTHRTVQTKLYYCMRHARNLLSFTHHHHHLHQWLDTSALACGQIPQGHCHCPSQCCSYGGRCISLCHVQCSQDINNCRIIRTKQQREEEWNFVGLVDAVVCNLSISVNLCLGANVKQYSDVLFIVCRARRDENENGSYHSLRWLTMKDAAIR